MNFKVLYSLICGYVNISVEGYYIERFINICISKRIYLWNIKRHKSTYLIANISIKDFKRIRTVVSRTKCKIRINYKKGVPFLINKYKRRKFFAISLIMVFIVIFYLSNYIWNIEIKSDDEINYDEIKEELKAEGLDIGIRKNKINVNEMIMRVRTKRNDIAWMSIDISGTNAIINIKSSTRKPEIINKNEYCNIVANKSGVITKINAQNGTPQVKVGDVVNNGTILVGGWLEGKYTGKRYVHSMADVEARVWYEAKEKMEYVQYNEKYTELKEKRYSIKLNNFQINLYKRLPNFEKYDTIKENKKLKIFSNFYLPIELGIEEFREKVDQKITYNYDELQNVLITKLEAKLLNEIDDSNSIVNKQVNINETEDSLEVQLVYEVLEKIGIEEKIQIEE